MTFHTPFGPLHSSEPRGPRESDRRRRAKRAATLELAALSQPQPHILLADEDAATCEQLDNWLSRYGYTTAVARRPFVLAASRHLRDFDLILADADFRGPGNVRWLRSLLADPRCPPVILMTAVPRLETAIEAANLPIAGYFPKPLDPDALGRRIRHVLAHLPASRPRADRQDSDT